MRSLLLCNSLGLATLLLLSMPVSASAADLDTGYDERRPPAYGAPPRPFLRPVPDAEVFEDGEPYGPYGAGRRYDDEGRW